MTFCYYIISVQLFLQVRSFSTLEVFLYVQPILFLHTFISVFFLWSYESFSFYPTNTNFSYFFIPDCSTSNYMKCCFRCHLAFFFFFPFLLFFGLAHIFLGHKMGSVDSQFRHLQYKLKQVQVHQPHLSYFLCFSGQIRQCKHKDR